MSTTPITESSDLPLAAFIAARGVPVSGTRLDGRRVHFRFRLTVEEFGRLEAEYLTGGVIGAQLFASMFRRLKRLAFEVVDGEAGR